jgi:hypothetical protein
MSWNNPPRSTAISGGLKFILTVMEIPLLRIHLKEVVSQDVH